MKLNPVYFNKRIATTSDCSRSEAVYYAKHAGYKFGLLCEDTNILATIHFLLVVVADSDSDSDNKLNV